MRRLIMLGMCIVLLSKSDSIAQTQVTVAAPATTVTSDFSEQYRVGFGLNHPNFNLRFGRGPGFPPLGGGFAPANDGFFIGIPLFGGRLNGALSISAAQSASRSITTTVPMITTLDGAPGFFFSGTVQPFITGLMPVVGNGPHYAPPPPMSPVRSMLLRGDIKLEPDETGRTRLVRGDSGPRDGQAPENKTATTVDPFKRAMEKYAGSKR